MLNHFVELTRETLVGGAVILALYIIWQIIKLLGNKESNKKSNYATIEYVNAQISTVKNEFAIQTESLRDIVNTKFQAISDKIDLLINK